MMKEGMWLRVYNVKLVIGGVRVQSKQHYSWRNQSISAENPNEHLEILERLIQRY